MFRNFSFRVLMAVIVPAFILLSLLGAGSVQAAKTPAKIPVKWWVSSVNSTDTGMAKTLESQKGLYFGPSSKGGTFTIKIDDKKRYQQMDGFGASFTEASAWLVEKKLGEAARKDLMQKLFDKNKGIGISMLRQPIGACDHVIAPYTYDDKPDTDDLPNFSIDHDLDSIIPSIKEAMSVNPGRIKVMCATWSPPGWMKTNDSERGTAQSQEGTLLEDKYGAYANYILKFIQAYKKNGIPMYATSIQNEPDYASQDWPAMVFDAESEAKFIAGYLGPLFKKNGINTKIICWDHNFMTSNYIETSYPSIIYDNKEAAKYTAGAAFHWYSDAMELVLNNLHKQYPGKDIWFTEGSGGSWDPVQLWRKAFMTEMYYVVNLPRCWSKSIVWWNVALDELNGPDYYYDTYMKRHSTCRGLVQINKTSGKITYYPDYYTMGHISKFVDPGAYRIDSNTYADRMEDVAFVNPDGSKVLIVCNRTEKAQSITVSWQGRAFRCTIPAMAAATLKW